MFSGSHSEQDCCTRCSLLSQDTNIITNDDDGGDRRCWCQSVADPGTASTESGWKGWTGGTCSPSTSGGRRRRSGGLRAGRSTQLDTTKERRLECVSWLGGQAAYWKYDLEVPSRCYSMTCVPEGVNNLCSLLVVSCLQADLESIATNNQEIELSGPITSLYYGKTYK